MIDKIYNCDCIEGMRELQADSVEQIALDALGMIREWGPYIVQRDTTKLYDRLRALGIEVTA